MIFRPFCAILVIVLSITPIITGPWPPTPTPPPVIQPAIQLLCSAFCAPTGCTNYTSNDCNNNCNTGWGWNPLGTACALLAEWGLLDNSTDAGGTLVPVPVRTTSNCASLTTLLGGITPYGDFKANQIVTLTKPSGTTLAHFAVDLVFNIVLIDTNSAMGWSTCHLIAKLGSNLTRAFKLDSSTAITSQNNFCGSPSYVQRCYQVQLSFTHNSTNQDIAFSLTTNNTNINSLWVAKEFIVTLRLCSIACTSCTSSSSKNSCFACNVTLGFKLNNSSCFSKCVKGFGVTSDPGKCIWCDLRCQSCYQKTTNCSKCVTKGTWASSLLYNRTLGHLTCIQTCPAGSFSSNGQCIFIWGCAAVTFKGEAQTCVRCNSKQKLFLSNYTCGCIQGYAFDEAIVCQQVCGDGRLFELQCDDGNRINGDGCSSDCKMEYLYKCYNGTKDHKSECMYVGIAPKASRIAVGKVQGANQARITFDITPNLEISSKDNFIESLNFSCNSSFNLSSWTIEDSKVTILIDYQQNLQGKNAWIQVKLNSSLVRNNMIRYNFTINSQGAKLFFNGNAASVMTYEFLFQIIALSALAIFVVSNFTHKMIGVQTINSFQLVCFLCLANKNSTQLYLSLRFLTYTNLNLLFYQNNHNNYFQVEQNILYMAQNQFWTKLTITIALMLPLSFPILNRLSSLWISSDKRTKLLEKMPKRTYSCIWFPFSAGFLMQITSISREADLYKNVVLFIIMSLVFFYEWIQLFIIDRHKTYAGVEGAHRHYVAVYLTYSGLMVMVVHLANMNMLQYSLEAAGGLTTLFLIWFVVRRPYQDIIHNMGQLINLIMLQCFLTWSVLRIYMQETFTEDSKQMLCIVVISGLMVLSLLLAIVRFLYEIRVSGKRTDTPKEPQKKKKKQYNRYAAALSYDKQSLIIEEVQKYNRYCVDVMNLQRKFLDQNQFNLSRAMNDVFLIQKQQMNKQLNHIVHRRFKIQSTNKDNQGESLFEIRQNIIQTQHIRYT